MSEVEEVLDKLNRQVALENSRQYERERMLITASDVILKQQERIRSLNAGVMERDASIRSLQALHKVSRNKRQALQDELNAIRGELRIEEDNVEFVEAKLKQATQFSSLVFVVTSSPGGVSVGQFYRMYKGNWQTQCKHEGIWRASMYKDMYAMVSLNFGFELANYNFQLADA